MVGNYRIPNEIKAVEQLTFQLAPHYGSLHIPSHTMASLYQARQASLHHEDFFSTRWRTDHFSSLPRLWGTSKGGSWVWWMMRVVYKASLHGVTLMSQLVGCTFSFCGDKIWEQRIFSMDLWQRFHRRMSHPSILTVEIQLIPFFFLDYIRVYSKQRRQQQQQKKPRLKAGNELNLYRGTLSNASH